MPSINTTKLIEQTQAPGRQAAIVGALVFLGALLFLVATPAGGGPDERSHVMRLGGLASGSLFGTVPDAATFEFFLNPAQNERVRLEAGKYTLSPDFNFIESVGGDCNAFHAAAPVCASSPTPDFDESQRDQISYHARTQPLPYILPAITSRLGWNGSSTFFLSRLGMALQCSAMVAAGWWAFARRASERGATVSYGALAPMLVGLTPLAMSLVGIVSPSAFEICSALALVLVTWSLVQAPRANVRILFLAVLASTLLTRSVGIGFGLLAVLCGTWSAGANLRELLKALRPTGLAVTMAMTIASVLFDTLFKANMAPTVGVADTGAFVFDLSTTWASTTSLANNLGWLDVSLPMPVRTGFLLLGLWVIFASCLFGTRRWARKSVLLCGLYLLIGMAISRGLQPTGFGMQARFLLPGWAAIIAGCGLHLATVGPSALHRIRSPLLLGAWVTSIVVAVVTLVRRHEVGSAGPIWFIGEEGTAFRPLGGYAFLGVVLVAFVTLGVVTAVVVSRLLPEHDDPPTG